MIDARCPSCLKDDALFYGGVTKVDADAQKRNISGVFCHIYRCMYCNYETKRQVTKAIANEFN